MKNIIIGFAIGAMFVGGLSFYYVNNIQKGWLLSSAGEIHVNDQLTVPSCADPKLFLGINKNDGLKHTHSQVYAEKVTYKTVSKEPQKDLQVKSWDIKGTEGVFVDYQLYCYQG